MYVLAKLQVMCVHVQCVGQRRSVEMQKKLEIVELYNELKRFQEERQLLIKEMKNMLNFYYNVVLPSLSKDIAGTSKLQFPWFDDF